MLQLSVLLIVSVLIYEMATFLDFLLLLKKYLFLLVASVLVIIIITSIGITEANALQIGMDQLLEVSFTQLSAFIHW